MEPFLVQSRTSAVMRLYCFQIAVLNDSTIGLYSDMHYAVTDRSPKSDNTT